MDESEQQAQFCLAEHGFTEPTTVTVPCQCKSVTGEGLCKGHLIFLQETRGAALLECTVCGCAYGIEKTQHHR